MVPEVLQKGLYHRIVSMFIQDEQGRMLLQLRGPHVAVYPGCWDQAAGGHVDVGQDYERSAIHELAEELGLTNVPLKEIATYRYNGRSGPKIINQFVRVYLAQIPHDTVLQPDAHELVKVQWFTASELRRLISEHPEQCTPGLIHELRTYFPTMLTV